MYYYGATRLTETYSDVPPTIATHSLRSFEGKVVTFRVLRGGLVRIGDKIYSRAEAHERYSYLLQCNWKKV